MSHSISLPDALYDQLAALAEQQGQSVETLIEGVLAQIAQPAGPADATPRLDWDTATAEEIIADSRSRRIEQPPEL